MVALDKKNDVVKTFGLDRISNLKITDTKFKPFAYNVEKEFQHAFGVETYSPAEKIFLQFSNQQGKYIRSFPLHESQQIIQETENEIIVEVFIHLTNDFVMELLKYGSDVQVLEPNSLIATMKEKVLKMANLY